MGDSYMTRYGVEPSYIISADGLADMYKEQVAPIRRYLDDIKIGDEDFLEKVEDIVDYLESGQEVLEDSIKNATSFDVDKLLAHIDSVYIMLNQIRDQEQTTIDTIVALLDDAYANVDGLRFDCAIYDG